MNLHSLRIFAKVTETNSVTRAAEQLHISQPAVTAQIHNLEKDLQISLLHPKGRGIALTDAGLLLAGHARRLFALESEIELSLNNYRIGSTGKLCIATTFLPANFLLPLWIAQFKLQQTQVEFSLNTTNSQGAFDQLIHYEAELAVVGGIEVHPAIEKYLLFEDELWFVVPAHHPYANQSIALKELMQEAFIVREQGSSTKEKLVALCKTHNVDLPLIGLQLNRVNEIIRAVIAGCGASYVSSIEVKDYIERGEVARVFVDGIVQSNPISLCKRRADKLSPVAENFYQMIQNKFTLQTPHN